MLPFTPAVACRPGAPDVAPELGALLATLRLGGDPARPLAHASGITTARHAKLLGEQLQPLAHRLWPEASRRAQLILDIMVTVSPGNSIVGSVRLLAPPDPKPAQPPRRLGAAALELPLRLPVRLASEDVPLHRLLPLQPGLVIPFHTVPDMPVMLGDHQVGLASLVPLPDGRQQASLIALAIQPAGERP